MSWTIAKINTGTGEVTMRDEKGKTLNLLIPPEHRQHPERGAEHLRTACQQFDDQCIAITVPDLPNPFPWIYLGVCVGLATLVALFVLWVKLGD